MTINSLVAGGILGIIIGGLIYITVLFIENNSSLLIRGISIGFLFSALFLICIRIIDY